MSKDKPEIIELKEIKKEEKTVKPKRTMPKGGITLDDDDKVEKGFNPIVFKVKNMAKDVFLKVTKEEMKVFVSSAFSSKDSFVIASEERLQKSTILNLPLQEIFAVHPLSKRKTRKLETGKSHHASGVGAFVKEKERFDHGVLICRVDFKNKKFEKVELKVRKWLNKAKERQLMLINDYDRKMLVVVNEKAGKKKGKQIFKFQVNPILKFAHLQFDVVYGTSQEDVRKIGKEFDLDVYSEIGIVGGDGTLFDIISGLMNHKYLRFEDAMSTKISVFPSGTGNGISLEVGSRNSPVIAAVIAARGKFVKFDIASVFAKNKRHYSCFFTCVGAIASANQAVSRSLGEAAFFIGGFLEVLKLNYHKYTYKYVKVEGGEKQYAEKPKYVKYNAWANPPEFDRSMVCEEGYMDSNYPSCPLIKKYFMEELKIVAPSYVKKVSEEQFEDQESTQKCIVKSVSNEENFAFSVCSLEKFSPKMWAVPNCSFQDGTFDLLQVNKKLSRKEMVTVLKQMTKKTKDEYMANPNVSYEKVRAIYIQPKKRPGDVMIIDGERKKLSKVLIEVHKQLGCVTCL